MGGAAAPGPAGPEGPAEPEGGGGGPGGLSTLLAAGQQLAEQMRESNPELVEQLREQMRTQNVSGEHSHLGFGISFFRNFFFVVMEENRSIQQKLLPDPKSLTTFSHAPAGIWTWTVVRDS